MCMLKGKNVILPRPLLICICVALLLVGTNSVALAQTDAVPGWSDGRVFELGRTDAGTSLKALCSANALDPTVDSPLVVIAFRSTGEVSTQQVLALKKLLGTVVHSELRLVIVAIDPAAKFPPQGSAYNTTDERAAAALWRSLAWLGVDAVVEVTPDANADWPKDCLAQAVRTKSIAGVGTLPSARISAKLLELPLEKWSVSEKTETQIEKVLPYLSGLQRSPIREEFNRRRQRTPQQVAKELTAVYGHELKSIMYQPALAIVARRQFAELQQDPTVELDVAKVLYPYLAKAAAADLPKPDANGSVVSGHLVFADWALHTKDQRAVRLVTRAADVGFDPNGRPLPAMPSHNEMSDAVFMGCPILTSAARLSGEMKYLDLMRSHLAFMQKLCVRPDGLYRHSPLCEAAWGRGNGFPILGLVLALTNLQAMRDDATATPELRAAASQAFDDVQPDFQKHAAALLPHQDETGMWRQVIDKPSAYREVTATCMIGFALQRGIRSGWLDAAQFQPAADRAWQAMLPRIGSDGVLIDVCTGTGKQKSLQDYYDRAAILDRDERGGAMALLFAVERCR
ncbi:glycoside hydrolase family 88 protein [Planctomicrobium piriforme]|uniref:Rhamnogalacturonyl hydrolase YesR n=1 Tax=Planctomicrobium piriforme TaxID=1576369 RepID=A0A1I3SAA7_9PLAN|nr:glycoside hydrolase family 88 protein [Planctomicrobium piriforme]SFJ55625.1 Rhamnogalacturonyl hydrolase YesR [Planctomicrobium piriforme]